MNETREEAGATFCVGIITAVDNARGWARARIPEYDDLETALLPVLQRRTHKDRALDLPDIGEQVALLLDQRGEDGVILGALWSSEDPPPQTDGPDVDMRRYADGTLIRYDRAQHKLTADVKGEADLTATESVTVASQADITLAATGDLNLAASGSLNISAQGNTSCTGGGSFSINASEIHLGEPDGPAPDIPTPPEYSDSAVPILPAQIDSLFV